MAPGLFPRAEVDLLTPERVRAGLRTRRFGQQVLCLAQVASTNDVARERAREGAAEGLLVLAEEQTAGRGRRGRQWEAPYGSSLLASLLLRPGFLAAGQTFALTAMAGLAIGEVITQETGLEPALKWPNDLLMGGRKVCGILVELEGSADGLEWAVVGWGLNVNADFAGTQLAGLATSLAQELGRPLSRAPLLRACLERMEVHYEALRAGRVEQVWAAWRARLSTLGRPVHVAAPEGAFSGHALDVAPDGALLVRRDDGATVRVLAGDVSVRED
jgi:BirA family biotin operon repressor/biotin-[acetyl-CoA-carboxylase] ligase